MISTQAFHTFQLDTNSNQIEHIENEDQLANLVKLDSPLVILGEGSNSVLLEDFQGLVIVNDLVGIDVEEQPIGFDLKVKSGENWHQLVEFCLEKKIFGFENLALIPGTVGAAPIQNIGAYGVEIKSFITEVHYIDLINGTSHTLKNSECRFGYRDSIFKQELKNRVFITQVDFHVPKSWSPVNNYAPLDSLIEPTPYDIFHKVCETRRLKLPDPKVLGNAGSFFKNPIVKKQVADKLKSNYDSMPFYPVDSEHNKLAAGWLIEQAGLKGFEYKNVAVHDAQALVLVNKTGKATGTELIELIQIVRENVYNKFAVKLELEVRLIGANGEIEL